jgi:hypothetical protein
VRARDELVHNFLEDHLIPDLLGIFPVADA